MASDDTQENLQTGFRRTPLAEPTSAVPGTEEKILVLQGRVERGEELWHPLDGQGAKLVEKGRGPLYRREQSVAIRLGKWGERKARVDDGDADEELVG